VTVDSDKRLNHGAKWHDREVKQQMREHHDNAVFSLNPSDQMTFVLILVSKGYPLKSILRTFSRDHHLARILMTSLVASGFLTRSDDNAVVTDKGKSRLKSTSLLQSLCRDLTDGEMSPNSWQQ
jgi:hypothetical protein